MVQVVLLGVVAFIVALKSVAHPETMEEWMTLNVAPFKSDLKYSFLIKALIVYKENVENKSDFLKCLLNKIEEFGLTLE